MKDFSVTETPEFAVSEKIQNDSPPAAAAPAEGLSGVPTATQAVTRQLEKVKSVYDDASYQEMISSLRIKPRERYKFIRSVGVGGMKNVLLVRDTDTDREVALAMMPDFRERSHEEMVRFVREALITCKLEHPNIVPVHDVGIDSNHSPYFVMKYLRGRKLSGIIDGLALGDSKLQEHYTLRKLLVNFLKICRGMEFAHSQDIMHLDLKPGNIIFADYDEVHIIDWGAAQYVHAFDFRRSPTAEAFGTPGYMAPEQLACRVELLDERADVFSLGALLYSILTFKMLSPNSMHCSDEVIKATMAGKLLPEGDFTNKYRQVPKALSEVCRRAMAFHPVARYSSVAELREEIENYLSDNGTYAQKASPFKMAGLFLRRNLTLLLALLVLLLGTVLLLIHIGFLF